MSMVPFSIDRSVLPDHPDVTVVTMHGDVDAEVLDTIKSVVDPLLQDDTITTIVFDLSDVGYVNSRAVGLLMNFYGILKEHKGRTLALAGLQPNVKETVSLVGVSQLVAVYDSVAAFSASLGSGESSLKMPRS